MWSFLLMFLSVTNSKVTCGCTWMCECGWVWMAVGSRMQHQVHLLVESESRVGNSQWSFLLTFACFLSARAETSLMVTCECGWVRMAVGLRMWHRVHLLVESRSRGKIGCGWYGSRGWDWMGWPYTVWPTPDNFPPSSPSPKISPIASFLLPLPTT